MFKFIAVCALVSIASAAPGLITEAHHTVVQPTVLAKTAVVDTSASSAITHQSFTNLERKVPVVHAYAAAPVIKTVSAPVVHTYESAPVIKTVSAPVVHTYELAPVVNVHPVVKTVAAAAPIVHSLPVVHSVPVVKTVVSSPVAYHSYN